MKSAPASPSGTSRIERREDSGPFDIVGDVHGCFDECVALLGRLGYAVDAHDVSDDALFSARHPQGRRALFVGDFCDRGPKNVLTLRLAMGMCAAGTALAVVGNHDVKLRRWLEGRNVKIAYGLDTTVREFAHVSDSFRANVMQFIDALPSHLVLDDGKLVVAHAGLKEDFHGVDSGEARSFALYGDTTGERDDYGFPVRREWGRAYRGDATVVYGHTPMRACEWINKTICIDTGCVFGGHLTALRWPERELVSIPAMSDYWEPTKPLGLRSEEPV